MSILLECGQQTPAGVCYFLSGQGAEILKEKKWSWSPDIRKIILGGIGFLAGRVWMMGINPFGVAFFAGLCGEGLNRRVMAAAILLGMFTGADGLGLLKYIVLFSLILVTDSIQTKAGRERPSALFISALCGGLNLLLSAALSILAVNTWEMLGLCVLESVAIVALSGVFRWGIRYFLYAQWQQMPGNEEMISILALITIALCGIPRTMDSVFSVVGTIAYLMVLFAGYRFGAATGTMAGAAAGILSAVTGNAPVMVGVYCLLGTGVGMFRKIGRIGSSIAFLVMGYGMLYYIQGQETGVVEIRAMLSAVVLFLAIPGRITRQIEEDMQENGENLFAREDIRAVANSRINDFAGAFRRLSRSFMEGGCKKEEIPEEEIEDIYQELSEKICKDCVNCRYCWNRHFQETEENIHRLISGADEQESAAAAVSREFGRRCIRLDVYAEKAAERMAIARMNLGWHNRMAENREILARQMLEVSEALQSFTMEIGEPGEVTEKERRRMIEELKKEGAQIRQIAMKRKRGKLEVALKGSCRGGGCLTKTDLAQALSRGSGVRMCPESGCCNILSKDNPVMIFREDTKYKMLHGCARIAKSGESVSGDNFSFLEPGNGEFLMVLADGMGSGESACRDSGDFVEVLEKMLEAGFEKKAAVQMLNTLFVMNFEGQSFTTLDLVSVNLQSGICEIMKNGAAVTFVRRANRVDVFRSEALPVGVDIHADTDAAVTRLEEGDMILLMSDGVTDGLKKKGEKPEELLEQLDSQNPDEVANQVLMHALAGGSQEAADDMCVLAAGMWKKNSI